VKISGFLNVRQLIACFGTQAHSEMIGVKYCDLLKMQALFRIVDKEQHNTTCGRCQIIDLKYSLHSADLLTTQSKQSSRHALTRSDWESRHNFHLSASIGTARSEIDSASFMHERRYNMLRDTIRTSSRCARASTESRSKAFGLTPHYLSGIIQGDGCINVGVLTRHKRCYPRFTASFKLSCEQGSPPLLEVVACVFGDMKPYIARTPSIILQQNVKYSSMCANTFKNTLSLTKTKKGVLIV
jgi:hypothetical protein